VPSTARAVGGLFADLLDAWLVDTSDADLDGTTVPGGRARVHARPLLMTDLATSAAMAGAALDVGLDLVAAGRGA
jgi:LPPG:FO 2-phospho-L-lactate transferase